MYVACRTILKKATALPWRTALETSNAHLTSGDARTWGECCGKENGSSLDRSRYLCWSTIPVYTAAFSSDFQFANSVLWDTMTGVIQLPMVSIASASWKVKHGNVTTTNCAAVTHPLQANYRQTCISMIRKPWKHAAIFWLLSNYLTNISRRELRENTLNAQSR